MKRQISQSSSSATGSRMNLGMAAGLLYPLAQAVEDFFAVHAFAAVEPLDALAQPRFQFFQCRRDRRQASLSVLLQPARTTSLAVW
jgi:hypothetical protein